MATYYPFTPISDVSIVNPSLLPQLPIHPVPLAADEYEYASALPPATVAPYDLNSIGNTLQPSGHASGSISPDEIYPQPQFANGKSAVGLDGGLGKWKEAKIARDDKAKEAPVKNACLSCRTKKAKCDGTLPVCGQCQKKVLECVYVKSRRGGARKKRVVSTPSALQDFLKKLEGLLSAPGYNIEQPEGEFSDDITNIVRQFSSREELFRCYYQDVHPFLPVMPPPDKFDQIFPTLLADSPFLLSVQTVLVLFPHDLDPSPNSPRSKRLRVAASVALSKQTMSVVEHVLEHQAQSSIECVQALCILSSWEWANSSNLAMSRSRAGQAVQVAMELGVHEMDKHSQNTLGSTGRAFEGEDWRRDMARRTWWVVYQNQLSSALVSGTNPVIGPDDPRVKVNFPVCSLEDNAWPNWINTTAHCSRVFSIVNTVYYSDSGLRNAWGTRQDSATAEEREKMKQQILEIDRNVMDLMKQAEATAIIDLVPGGEEAVVRNQQMAARFGLAASHIHMHRQQAFPEVSLFSKKICGLPESPDQMGSASMVVQSSGSDTQPWQDSPSHSSTQSGPYMASSTSNGHFNGHAQINSELTTYRQSGGMDFANEMWQPDTYPENLPAPWFTYNGGAAHLWTPVNQPPKHLTFQPTASIQPVESDMSGARRSSATSLLSSSRPHKAWGVDAMCQTVKPAEVPEEDDKGLQLFPPGISLARCATAAHTMVRLEVLHRSASIAMSEGPPKWMPFCACGLVTGAYSFLLLALAVQAENTFGNEHINRSDEIEALLTNVKVILAGLDAYGTMWAGIEVMAGEVRAALEAAMRLPYEVRAEIGSVSPNEDDTNEADNIMYEEQ